MSLVSQVSTLTTRIGTEFKAIRTLIGGTGTSNISALTTTDKTSLVAAINEVKAGSSGAPPDASVTVKGLVELATDAETTTGTDTVRATTPSNVKAAIDARTASESAPGIVELATVGEATTGTDTARAVTPAGVAAAVNALIAGAPGALNTLDELAAALGDDANFAATITTSLAGKQPIDADLTAIAALVSAANKVPYSTGAGAWALADFTAAGRTLVGAADAAAQRTALSVYSTTEIGDPATNFVTVFEAAIA